MADDPDYDVEIICGARRYAAALALGRDLLVDVRAMNDAEAYVAMYEENAERKDDCPYVQGQILRRALLSGACSSQDDLAQLFSLSKSKVSRLLMIAQLPSVIVAAFQSPEDIRESWGVQLYQVWKANIGGHAITARARTLANSQSRPPARNVYQTLIGASNGKQPGHSRNRSLPVCGSSGAILFREQDGLEAITYTISKTILSPRRRDSLKQAIVHILESHSEHTEAVNVGPTTENHIPA